MSATQLRPRANEHADQLSTAAKESNVALSVPESHSIHILGDTKAPDDSGKVDEFGQQQLSDRVSGNPCLKETAGQASIHYHSSTPGKSTKWGFNNDPAIISKEEADEHTNNNKKAIWTQIRDALRIDEEDLDGEIGSDRQVPGPVRSRGWPCEPCNDVAPPPSPPPPPPQWMHSASDFFPRYALGLPQEDVVAWVLEERMGEGCVYLRGLLPTVTTRPKLPIYCTRSVIMPDKS